MLSALRYAWQSWKSAKGVAALAIAAFAVGIGSATAIYTVVNGVMLKPLPYAEGDRFVVLFGGSPTEPNRRSAHRFPDLIEYQRRLQNFDVFGWFRSNSFNIVFEKEPQHVLGAEVTPELAKGLGVNPILGHWFPDDRSVVIAEPMWRRLGSDPQIVGKPIAIDGRPFTISGVAPPGFRLPVRGPGVDEARAEVWLPLDPTGRGQSPDFGNYLSYARLKPGVTLAQAQADAKRVAAELVAMKPGAFPSYTAYVDDLRAAVVLDLRPTLMLLIVAAGVVLLITCADVAGLLLTRAVSRARETAIRVAVGCERWQLAMHYFAEAMLVSVAGAAAGLVVSVVLVRSVLAIAADRIPRADEISIDWSVLLFAIAVACLTSAFASLAPLWQALRVVPNDALSDGVRSTQSARSRRVSRLLVVGEIALAFTLLAISAVLVGHLRHLTRVEPGFDANNLLTFRLTAGAPQAEGRKARLQFQEKFTEALERIPGVVSVGFANQLPLEGCCFTTAIYPEGRPVDLGEAQRISFIASSVGFLRTLQAPLRSGRLLDERDIGDTPILVVINEAAVRTYWPGQNALGAFGRIGAPDGSRFQVVGIVGDIRNDGLGKPTVPEIHLSAAFLDVNPMRFMVRSPLPASVLVPQIRRAIQAIDPAQPIHHVSTVRDILDESVSQQRVSSFMMAVFAIAALIMASLGIYGVVAYAVRQGTVEIGTRMALGAIGRDVLFLFLGNGLRMSAYGAAIGSIAVIAGAWGAFGALEIPNPGVLPFAASFAIVGFVGSGASFFPAWRATLLSPMVAIRNDPQAKWQETRRSVGEALKELFRAVSLSSEASDATEDDLLAEFVTAARGAASYDEAFQRALALLRDRIGAASIVLLERRASGYRRLASIPEGTTAAYTLDDRDFLANRLRFYRYPYPFTTTDLESWLRWARDNNFDYIPEIQALLDANINMAVGLRARGELLGVLLLGPLSSGEPYSFREKRLLQTCAEQLTLMIENARLTARVVEQEKVRRDLALAAEVQKRLLPERPPARDGASLAAVSLPARSVGGDYYDFLELGDHQIGIALADVAGKGVAAALIMAVVQASLRIVASERETSLPDLAARINRFLHGSTGSSSYATFFYAQLDERSRELRYVNAGHNPPYLLRTSEDASVDSPDAPAIQIRELNVGGTVLGLFPQMTYEEAVVQLRSGDVLVAFTDGVTEALNISEQEFGEDRLKALLREIVHLPVANISARISEELKLWIKDTAQYDDLTFVVMKVT